MTAQLWRQFIGTMALAGAQAYCNTLTKSCAFPADGVTKVWAAPAILADGSYVVPVPPNYTDALAVPWGSNWAWPQPSGPP